MSDYTDEALRDGIDALRGALVRLGRVRDALGQDELLRERISRELARIDDALDELELVYDQALDEAL